MAHEAMADQHQQSGKGSHDDCTPCVSPPSHHRRRADRRRGLAALSPVRDSITVKLTSLHTRGDPPAGPYINLVGPTRPMSSRHVRFCSGRVRDLASQQIGALCHKQTKRSAAKGSYSLARPSSVMGTVMPSAFLRRLELSLAAADHRATEFV
jgi:hypothetical protein